MRIAFALPGLHRVNRGAEVAFESVAQEIALAGADRVTLIGSGLARADRAYGFQHVPATPRERFERWPKIPVLRNETSYEELTFVAGLVGSRAIAEADATVTCSYPFTNWALRGLGRRGRRNGTRPAAHVFVTQNGDYPAITRNREYRLFSCDGLVCTNPTFFARCKDRWLATLIPNGIDPSRFHQGPDRRAELGLPTSGPIILMVSALVPGKRVLEGMRAVARISGAFMIVAGDGPLREEADLLAAEILPGRFSRRSFKHEQMADLYRSVDVFLHTTIGESFGNVYIEALASGLPVVAHDESLTRWIFEDHACLVDTTKTEPIVEALKAALDVPATTRANGANFAKRYDWRVIASQYRAFISDVVARRG